METDSTVLFILFLSNSGYTTVVPLLQEHFSQQAEYSFPFWSDYGILTSVHPFPHRKAGEEHEPDKGKDPGKPAAV